MVTFTRPSHLPRFDDPAPTPARAARIEEVPVPGNVDYLFALGSDEFCELRGVALRVPPVPALDGAELYRLKTRVHNAQVAAAKRSLTEEEHEEHARTIVKLQKRMTRLLRPVRSRDKLRRLLGIWRPLHHATEYELGQMLDFLLVLRAKSVIRFRSEMATN